MDHPPARRKDGDVPVQLSKGLGVPQVAGHIGAVRHLDANDVLVLADELHQGIVRVGVLGSRVVLEDDQGHIHGCAVLLPEGDGHLRAACQV